MHGSTVFHKGLMTYQHVEHKWHLQYADFLQTILVFQFQKCFEIGMYLSVAFSVLMHIAKSSDFHNKML